VPELWKIFAREPLSWVPAGASRFLGPARGMGARLLAAGRQVPPVRPAAVPAAIPRETPAGRAGKMPTPRRLPETVMHPR
jgi:hypothetical protein